MTATQRTLLILYPGCIEYEVMLAVALLGPKIGVDAATPDGCDHASETGLVFRASTSYRACKPSDYNIVLIPGGNPESIIENSDIDKLLQACDKKSAILAAICAGPIVLAKAGLLKGRNFTHGYGDMHREFLKKFWMGAEFVDQPVVINENIITAKPEAHIDFAVQILKSAGILEDDRAAIQLAEYYKGSIP